MEHKNIETISDEEKQQKEKFLEQQKIIENFVKEILGFKEISNMIILADGIREKDDKFAWNWRIKGYGPYIVSLIEEFKIALVIGKLNNSKILDQSKETLKDTTE